MTQKRKHLIFGIILDAIGYASYAFPVFGEGIDFIWAPLSAFIMIKMYEGTMGKVGGAIQFIEEALPFSDFVPTYTIMWVYKYVLKKTQLLLKNLIKGLKNKKPSLIFNNYFLTGVKVGL